MTEIILKDEAYTIIAAAIEVHRVLGPGFAEPVYQEAHEIELGRRDVPFEAQKPLVNSLQRPAAQEGVCRRLDLLSTNRRRVKGA